MFDKRLLIITGKGGVGRSAVSAALALRSAYDGKRVLAVAMTDGAGLAAHLGVDRLSYTPTRIRPGLEAMAIQRPAALNEYLRVQLGVPRVAQLGPVARAFDAVASTAPGIREVITIGKVLYEARSGPWDLVVADGPPTGQIGSHLRAPTTVARLVGTGRVRDQTAWMTHLLTDDTATGLVVVTIPEELPVTETLQSLEDVRDEGLITTAAVVVNRTLPALGTAADDIDHLEDGPAKEAALLHTALYEEQQRWLRDLPDGPQIPYLFGLHTPPEVAARIADLWRAL
ncbi:MAG: ArsA family ATPase [Actinobacteria bacterium]|nr:ArsA family ATPase [Actinomycetota bacterium]